MPLCGTHAAAFSLRPTLRALLRHFVRTPNFLAWLRSRVRQVDRQLRRVYLTALCEADVAAWMKDKHEIRRVDFMLRVQDELVRDTALNLGGLAGKLPALTSCILPCWMFCHKRSPTAAAILGSAGVERLRAHVATVVQGLPDDLRRSLEAQAAARDATAVAAAESSGPAATIIPP